MSIIYVNGAFIPEGTSCLTVEDRSFRFGDGIFETALVHAGRVFDWPAHAARLTRGLRYFALEADVASLTSVITQLIQHNHVQEGYVRVVVSRGDNLPGAVGYKPGKGVCTLVVQVFAKPLPVFSHITLDVSDVVLANVFPCKTNSALPYTLAFLRAAEKGLDNALMLDAHGHVCETANGNLCWFEGGVLCYPEADLPMVPGTVQARVLSLWQGETRPVRIKPEALTVAEEILMTNIGGLVSAISAIPAIGFTREDFPRTQALRERLLSIIHHETRAAV